jgi:hypothetical protein
MRRVWYGATMLGVAATVGCSASRDVTEPAPRAQAPVEASASRSGTGGGDEEMQKVTGSALFQIVIAGSPVFQHFSVAAIRHRDGSFSGAFEEKSEQDGGQREMGEIYCFSIVADTARIAGLIKKSNIDFGPPGSYVIWNVVDGGKAHGHDRHGRGDRDTDFTTDFYFSGTKAQADAHCAANLLRGQPYYPVLRGELKVEE